MNRSRDIRSRRILAFMAMVFGAILTTMVLPSYGQQDVDPTWYDPYAVSTLPSPAPHTVAIHSSQAPLSIHQQQTTLTSASLSQGAERFRAKQSTAGWSTSSSCFWSARMLTARIFGAATALVRQEWTRDLPDLVL